MFISENENDLQTLLFIVQNWCHKWRLQVNLSKTNIIHIRKKRQQQSRFTFLFNNRPVSYVKQYKYLGVIIDEHLDFKVTIGHSVNSAGRALSTIITKMIKNGGLPFNVYSLLYNSCVVSIADYSAALTGFEENEALLQLHMRALRAFLGVPKNACNYGILSEFQMLMPMYRTKLAMIRFFHRVLKMNENSLPKKLYLWDRHLYANRNLSCWSHEVQSIFESCNCRAIFDSHSIFNLRETIKSMTVTMLNQQRDIIAHECASKPKLRTFISFKVFETGESYITKPISFIQRRILARLRLGCLPLRIETGRYQVPRLPEEQRTCQVCPPDEQQLVIPIESEHHFMFNCRAYETERKAWFNSANIPENFYTLTDGERFKAVFSNPTHLKHVANYILAALSVRSRLLLLT